jgi:hypothetical protein
LVVGLQRPATRDFAPSGWRGGLELQRLRVAQGDVGHRIAGRRDFVAHQADDRKFVPVRAQRDFLADCETGRAVDDHFVVAAHDLAPARQLTRPAGAARLKSDEEHAQRFAVELGLHRLVGDRAGALHAIDPADQFARVAGDA